MFGRSRALLRRAGWGVGDQVISSLTNALPSILVARVVDAGSFGVFGLAFALYSFAVGISRAFSSQPFSVHHAAAPPQVVRRGAAASTGCALVLGVAGGVVSAACGVLVGGVPGACLAVLGAALPGLLLQDAWRYVFFTTGRPASAALNDGFWGVSQTGLLLVVLHLGGGIAPVLAAWGAAAAAAAALGAWQAGVWPAPRAAVRWLREHRGMTSFSAAEYAVNLGVYNAALAVLGGLGQLALVGAIRGAQVLFGPLRVLLYAAQSYGLAEVARRAARTPGGVARDCAAVAAVLGGSGVVATVLLVLMPSTWGEALLGDTWATADNVLPAVGAQLVAVGLLGGALLGLQVRGRTRVSFTASLIQAPFTVGLGIGGALLAGPVGAAVSFALAHCVAPTVCWYELVRGGGTGSTGDLISRGTVAEHPDVTDGRAR